MESWGGERSGELREAKLHEEVLMTQGKTVRTCLVRTIQIQLQIQGLVRPVSPTSVTIPS
jgi:hypothetical protein